RPTVVDGRRRRALARCRARPGRAAADDLRRRREVARAGAGQGVSGGRKEMNRTALAAVLTLAAVTLAKAAAPQAPDVSSQSSGAAIFARDCASCHDGAAGSRAPSPDLLKRRSPEA